MTDRANTIPHKQFARPVTIESIPIINPWDRQVNESSKYYSMFVLYRDMGGMRTFTAVANDFGYSQAGVKAIATRHAWEARIAEWEIEIEKVKQEAFKSETAKMARRHARRAIKMQMVGENRIDQFLGDPSLMDEMSASEAAKLVSEGAKLERMARGEDKANDRGPAVVLVFNGQAPPKWAPKDPNSNRLAKGITIEAPPDQLQLAEGDGANGD